MSQQWVLIIRAMYANCREKLYSTGTTLALLQVKCHPPVVAEVMQLDYRFSQAVDISLFFQALAPELIGTAREVPPASPSICLSCAEVWESAHCVHMKVTATMHGGGISNALPRAMRC